MLSRARGPASRALGHPLRSLIAHRTGALPAAAPSTLQLTWHPSSAQEAPALPDPGLLLRERLLTSPSMIPQQGRSGRANNSLAASCQQQHQRSFFGAAKQGNPQKEGSEGSWATAEGKQEQEQGQATEAGAGAGAGAEGQAAEEEASAEAAAEDPQEKEKEIAGLRERVLRAYADMENMRDRMLREHEQIKLFAVQGFAKGLLDVADNLGRARSVAAAAFEEGKETEAQSAEAVRKQLKSLLEGVEGTERQLLKVFKSHKLERFSPVNEPFDPNLHEAMFQVPDPTKEPGTVVQVLKDGYKLHGRVLRAAEVGVTRKVE